MQKSHRHMRVAALSALSLVGWDKGWKEKSTSSCCGIVGVIGTQQNAKEILLEGLTVLQTRGYDSAGMCTLQSQDSSPQLVTSKFANSNLKTTGDAIVRLRRASELHQNTAIGIAHTRWATQGAKTDANAHPHYDYKNRIALVHNGSLQNTQLLRKKLRAHGITFCSDTDSEVIAQLIGLYLDRKYSLVDAVKSALGELMGTWGVAVLSCEGELVVGCHGSPMAIGIGNDQMFVASEVSAFRRHTDTIIELEDGEVVLVHADGASIDRSRIKTADKSSHQQIPLSSAPWAHWTLREIEEQPEAISRALNFGGRLTSYGVTMGGLTLRKDELLNVQHLIVTGCGSSMHAGVYGAHLMESLRAFHTVRVVDATTLSMQQLNTPNGGLLALSQSGETKDVLDGVTQAQKINVPCFSITNGVGSRIALTTKIGAYQNAGLETAVTSTKSFSTQVTVMALVACWFAQHRGLGQTKEAALKQALFRLPAAFTTALSTRDYCKEGAALLEKAESCVVVGSAHHGANAIAAEGAMKFRELACLHSTTYVGEPEYLLQSLLNDQPVVMLLFENTNMEPLLNLSHQLRDAGVPLVIITDSPSRAANIGSVTIPVPENGALTPLSAIVPLQLIAYELALLRGYNPDVPRNLSKTVKD
ncbi:Aste57867_18054 [Aphanomyces stellatus]|uniref:Glutamine--fructose-6-phosphate aminotransferase [isomerizing] n=1 Tax=Aphanomyces stellatus TaxID=120398 RepID=A0A485LAT3_9STRA|nr:hypothetical protein As57867_017992 [Aphanomyces stellatus]VFT94793.1 Aste57867_18054 [Aphanomyces stellatus]